MVAVSEKGEEKGFETVSSSTDYHRILVGRVGETWGGDSDSS